MLNPEEKRGRGRPTRWQRTENGGVSETFHFRFPCYMETGISEIAHAIDDGNVTLEEILEFIRQQKQR